MTAPNTTDTAGRPVDDLADVHTLTASDEELAEALVVIDKMRSLANLMAISRRPEIRRAAEILHTALAAVTPTTGGELAGTLWLLDEIATHPDVWHPTDPETHQVVRAGLVWQAVALAADLRLPVGVQADEAGPGQLIVHIGLPTGRVSWTIAAHLVDGDDHDPATQHERIEAYGRLVDADHAARQLVDDANDRWDGRPAHTVGLPPSGGAL
jgi:hypothetical protein